MSDKVLIFCPFSSGGIAEHTHYQAMALQKAGIQVVVICSTDYLKGRSRSYTVKHCLVNNLASPGKPGPIQQLAKASGIICNQWRLAWEITRQHPSLVLIACYAEYLSPFWIWPHLLLSRVTDCTYGANLHDPVRDYQIGPAWWHHLSVWLAYLPLRFGLVHQRLQSPSPIPAHVEVIEAPVGVYDLTQSVDDPLEIRRSWGIPLGKKVFLALGYIRNNKNLDLVIRALVDHADACLVIMGTVPSIRDRQMDFYHKLAVDAGVSDRVRIFEGFVADDKLASYFTAADFIVLTYGASFRSQSGVLNIAARARRPVLASAGPSPMQDAVKRFHLGVFVEPDSVATLSKGIESLLSHNYPEPQWDGYAAYASWDINVKILMDAARRFHSPKSIGQNKITNE